MLSVSKQQKKWEKEYAAGKWECLEDVEEIAHYAVVAGLAHYYATLQRVLDIGCGKGILQRYLNAYGYKEYVGFDFSASAIDQAEDLPKASFVCADASVYKPEGKFTCIIFNECLHYIPKQKDVVERYIPYLTKGGYVIVSLYVDAPKHRRNAIMSQVDRIPTLRNVHETLVSNDRGIWTVAAFEQRSK